jgi:hypothetical protein
LLVVPKKFLALHAEELCGIKLSSQWKYKSLQKKENLRTVKTLYQQNETSEE